MKDLRDSPRSKSPYRHRYLQQRGFRVGMRWLTLSVTFNTAARHGHIPCAVLCSFP